MPGFSSPAEMAALDIGTSLVLLRFSPRTLEPLISDIVVLC